MNRLVLKLISKKEILQIQEDYFQLELEDLFPVWKVVSLLKSPLKRDYPISVHDKATKKVQTGSNPKLIIL